MIPIQIRDHERSALNILKPAIESALYQAGISIEIPDEYTGVLGFYDHNLKINKISYAAIEEFDLPLLRTWYKYGQYEPYDELRPKNLSVADNSENAYIPSKQRTDVTQDDITEYLLNRDLEELFNKSKFEFLIDNYKEWDPEPYTNTYIASTNIIRVLEKLNDYESEEIIDSVDDIRPEFKQASLDMRYDLENIDTFDDDLYEHCKSYLIELENTLRYVDETSEISEEQIDTIKQARNIYHEYVWPWAALNISLDKIKGPHQSARDFGVAGENILKSDMSKYNTQLTGWKTELESHNLSVHITSSQQSRLDDSRIGELHKATLIEE